MNDPRDSAEILPLPHVGEGVIACYRKKVPPLRYWLALVDGEPRGFFSSWEGTAGVGQARGEPFRAGRGFPRQLDQFPHKPDRHGRLHRVDPLPRDVQDLGPAVDRVGGGPDPTRLLDLHPELGDDVLRCPQPGGHRPERVRQRGRPVDCREEPVEVYRILIAER